MSSLWHRRRQDKSLAAIQRTEDSCSDATSLSAALISKSYQLHEQIGEGSSGRVYRGLRIHDQMEVALKCLEAKDKELVELRKQEYEVLHQLEHPNIVQALDFLTCSKLAVVVLSYNNGSTLDVAVRRAENGCFSEAQSQLLFLQLMQAVEYMHSKRVIHRDIKDGCVDLASGRLQRGQSIAGWWIPHDDGYHGVCCARGSSRRITI